MSRVGEAFQRKSIYGDDDDSVAGVDSIASESVLWRSVPQAGTDVIRIIIKIIIIIIIMTTARQRGSADTEGETTFLFLLIVVILNMECSQFCPMTLDSCVL